MDRITKCIILIAIMCLFMCVSGTGTHMRSWQLAPSTRNTTMPLSRSASCSPRTPSPSRLSACSTLECCSACGSLSQRWAPLASPFVARSGSHGWWWWWWACLQFAGFPFRLCFSWKVSTCSTSQTYLWRFKSRPTCSATWTHAWTRFYTPSCRITSGRLSGRWFNARHSLSRHQDRRQMVAPRLWSTDHPIHMLTLLPEPRVRWPKRPLCSRSTVKMEGRGAPLTTSSRSKTETIHSRIKISSKSKNFLKPITMCQRDPKLHWNRKILPGYTVN